MGGCWFFFFFFNDPATTEIYTLSLHDALPILLFRRDRGLAGYLLGEKTSIVVAIRVTEIGLNRHSEEEDGDRDDDLAEVFQRENAPAFSPVANGDNEFGRAGHVYSYFK